MQAHKNDLALLEQAARSAGDIALRYFKSDPETWDKGGGAGPVTEADLAIDGMLKADLMAARPDYGWLSEETEDDSGRLCVDRIFIVDPIDGTRAFIEGSSHWSHSLAVAQRGQITAAAVYLPVQDHMFTAALGGGAFLNGDPISVGSRNDINGACILGAKPNFDQKYWPGGVPDIKRSFRSSLAYRLCLVANGAFDGMLTLRPTWEWDVAAGTLIAVEAGAHVSDQSGKPVLFNSPSAQLHGMVAANSSLHTSLIHRLGA